MKTYYPNHWCLVRVTHQDGTTACRVMCGWHGGYVNGDSWKLSSGIIRFSQEENTISFFNESGSCYVCDTRSEGLGMYAQSVLNSYIEDAPKHGARIETITVQELTNYLKTVV